MDNKTETISGVCDICHEETTDLKMTKDPEEGVAGADYDVCPKCFTEIRSFTCE